MRRHAVGADVPIDESLCSVTTRGLFAAPLAAMTSGVARLCSTEVFCASHQMTSLGVVAEQPATGLVSAASEYPAAYVVFVGNQKPCSVTGYGFGLLIESTTSPTAPG